MPEMITEAEQDVVLKQAAELSELFREVGPTCDRENRFAHETVQAYKDSGSGAVAVGANVRVSKDTWDPEQPAQKLGGLSQYPCAGATDPCQRGDGFIGDYLGLSISAKNIYTLSASTHYPSGVTADEGGPIYYQQQVLATVPRSGFGSGY